MDSFRSDVTPTCPPISEVGVGVEVGLEVARLGGLVGCVGAVGWVGVVGLRGCGGC